jgi:hypothetical protein
MNKQIPIEWLYEKTSELINTYINGELSRKDLIDVHLYLYGKAKTLRNDEIIEELKLIGNYFDVSKLNVNEHKHHIRFTSIIKDRIEYYHKTYKKDTPVSLYEDIAVTKELIKIHKHE